MRQRYTITATVAALCLVFGAARAEEPSPRAAVERSLPLIQKTLATYVKQRACFACHHNGVGILALARARKHRVVIDEALLQDQLRFTHTFLNGAREEYLQGKGQGGQVDTAGYALLALAEGGWKPDEATAAVTEYLLRRDDADGYWKASCRERAPSENSPFTATGVAIQGLAVYATPEQAERVTKRRERARTWALENTAASTEERVFRLRILKGTGALAEEVRSAATALASAQRPDGGWAQEEWMDTDAYATGTALLALHDAGGMAADDPVYRRGVAYLVRTQKADGSWFVSSRSRPFQPYFESGFPYGKDQWISMAATSWAVGALAEAVP